MSARGDKREGARSDWCGSERRRRPWPTRWAAARTPTKIESNRQISDLPYQIKAPAPTPRAVRLTTSPREMPREARRRHRRCVWEQVKTTSWTGCWSRARARSLRRRRVRGHGRRPRRARPWCSALLQVHRGAREGEDRDAAIRPRPAVRAGPRAILDALLLLYLNTQILRALHESLAGELDARMSATSSATGVGWIWASWGAGHLGRVWLAA